MVEATLTLLDKEIKIGSQSISELIFIQQIRDYYDDPAWVLSGFTYKLIEKSSTIAFLYLFLGTKNLKSQIFRQSRIECFHVPPKQIQFGSII